MDKLNNKSSLQKLLDSHKKSVRLNIGCGTDYKKGWINIDNNSDNNIVTLDLNLDLRDPLPFEDNTADFIFNEHFFEHLSPEVGVKAMQDMLRVLKPDGVMRIAMPDLESVVHHYLHVPLKDDPVIKDFKIDFVKTPAEWINMSFRWWGHEWLYDYEELVRRLMEAGAHKKNISRKELRKSDYPELRNLEIRDGSTLIVEVIK